MSDWLINSAIAFGILFAFVLGCWAGSRGAHSEGQEHGHELGDLGRDGK